MRVGDYATAGSTNISVVDSDSFWIDGYFEDTNDHTGIATGNASPSTQGLPNVDPVYTWVRLAQRVPVRAKIEQLPKDIPLVAGMTATVKVRNGRDSRWSDVSSSWSPRLGEVSDLFRGVKTLLIGASVQQIMSLFTIITFYENSRAT